MKNKETPFEKIARERLELCKKFLTSPLIGLMYIPENDALKEARKFHQTFKYLFEENSAIHVARNLQAPFNSHGRI